MEAYGFIPRYQRIYNAYKDRIISQSLQPGTRMDSINRIMQKHSVSRDTAKMVLKLLVQDGLVISRVGSGSYVSPTQQLKPSWGIVIPFMSPNVEKFIGLLLTLAEKHNRNITHLFHYNNADEETHIVGTMIREGYEAIIVIPNYNEELTSGFYRNLIAGKTKLILADNTMAGSYFNYVVQSYDLGIKRAVAYFTGQNAGNILFIKDHIWQGRNLLQELMEQTLQLHLQMSGLSSGVFVIENATTLTKDYLRANNIQNVFTCIDMDAVKVIGRLKDWGYKIPEDISIVNYGNTEATRYFTPAITSIDCNYEEMSEKIAELIFAENDGKVTQYVISPKLIQRET